MAMNGIVLGNKIVDDLMAQNGNIDGTEEARLRVYWILIATDIVTHIQSFAVVTTTGADPQGGTVPSTGTVA